MPETVAETAAASASQPAETPVSGSRQAFDDVLRPLTSEDLASPGTQKLVLYMLQQARADAEQAEGYMERFHQADKRSAVLQEKLDAQLRSSRAVEIAMLTGSTLGGAAFGFATYFWSKSPSETASGVAALVFGLGLFGGAVVIKLIK